MLIINEYAMELNKLPFYDASDNPTGCCPRFKPEGWDKQELHFKDKPFVKGYNVKLLSYSGKYGTGVLENL